MPRILVADKIAAAGLERLEAAEGVSHEIRQGLAPAALARIIGDYDGILIRSAVKLTAETFARPGRLAAVARAGVGVDNVDLDAATAAGVLVLNTPDANTLSTAEHTLAVMLALFRNIPGAHAHVVAGQWKRSGFQGDQLAGKTLGIVGLGRIGRTVATRALGFDMEVLAYDPFIKDATALSGKVRMVASLDELLGAVDCLTLHASLSEETRHLIGREELARMKPTAKLINCARGALIDEHALAEALNGDRLGGAALDVYENEPPEGSPLLTAKNVVLTPHLAASTVEAQERVSVDAVEAILAYLLRGEIRSAVNVAGLPQKLTSRGRAYVDLCARMGALLSPWCTGGVDRVTLTTFGEPLEALSGTLAWQALVSVLGPHMDTRLNLVNARELARSRGIQVEHASRPTESGFTESVALTVETDGQAHTTEGAVWADHKPRVLSIDGYRMELIPEKDMVLIFNDDQPGVIGLVGQKFGQAKINIADMALSRHDAKALMVLKLDQPITDVLRDDLRRTCPPILSVHDVSLPPVVFDGTNA